MANEEKIGTLQYDMLINEELLKKQLVEIDKLLKTQDEKWKKALSNVGAGYAADTQKMTAANKAVAASTEEINGKIKALRAELKKNVKEYENMKDTSNSEGRSKLELITQQKFQLNELNKLYNSQITRVKELAKEAARLAKEAATQAEKITKLSYQKKYVAPNTVAAIDISTKQLETMLQTKGLSRAQIDNLSAGIAANNQKRKELIETIKKQAIAERQAVAEEKLRLAVNAQQVGSIARLRAEIALYAYQLSQIKKITPESKTQIESLNKAIADNKNRISDLQPTLGIWGKLKSAIATYTTAYLSVQGVIASARAIYNQTKQLDQLNFSMQTVIKSTSELAQTQKFLGEVAINYGGDLLTLSERYIKFRAAAIQSNMTADETQKIFNSVSKAAGTLGLKTDELSGVYLALEQMISKGKVTTEELRRQLGERLPGAFGIMANALGKTIPELDKMLKKGEVLSKDALPKFAIALEKAYGIENLKKIDTLAAAQGRLSTQTTLLIKSIGASDTFKSFINGLASAISFVKEYMGVFLFLGRTVATAAAALAVYRIGLGLKSVALMAANAVQRVSIALYGQQIAAINGADFATKRAALSIYKATTATTLLGRAWNILKLAFVSNPIGLIIAGLTTLGVVLYQITKGSKDATVGIKSFADNMTEQTTKLNTLFNTLEKTSNKANLYKNLLFDINNLYGKYLPNLLTEKSSLEEITKARELANEGLRNELLLKEQQEQLAQADEDRRTKQKAEYEKVVSPRFAVGTEADRGLLASLLLKASDEKDIAKAKEQVDLIINDFIKKSNFTKAQLRGGAVGDYINIVRKAALDLIQINEDYEKKKQSIKNKYPAKTGDDVSLFDIESIDAAEKAYKDALIFVKQGKENLIEMAYFNPLEEGKQNTLADWINEQINSIDTKNFSNKEEALRVLYRKLADISKDELKGGGTTDNIALKALKERLDLVRKMKTAYDDLSTTLAPSAAQEEIAKQFAEPMKELKVEINPQLNTDNFIKELQLLAEMAKKIDKQLYESILEIISSTATKQTEKNVSEALDKIEREINQFKEDNELKQAIFNITGLDRGIITDDIQFLKDKIIEMAKATGDIKFGGTFDELVVNLDKITPSLKSKIETLQKYIADKSSSTLLDALKFVYQKLPEGTDLQFDFSNILTELDKVLGQAKVDIENFTKEDVLKKGIGLFTKDQVIGAAEAQVNVAVEKARDEIGKLAAAYIKNNLTLQMRNDFKNMADASIASIRDISKALDEMMLSLGSKAQLEGLFKVAGIEAEEFKGILEGIKGTSNIDDFKIQVTQLGESLANAVAVGKDFKIGEDIVSETGLTKLKLFQKLIRALFGELESAQKEVKNKAIEKLVSDLGKLENELGNVIDSASGLAEAFGANLTESAKASLDAIKTTATGIVSIISGVSKLASQSISAVEKASVILGIISVAMQVISSIKSASNKAYQEQYQREQEILDMASKYNIALRQRNILLEQANIIFGENKYLQSISYITEMKEATDALAVALEKIRKSKTTIPTITIVGGVQVYDTQKLLSKFPDLIKEGKFNLLEAESILANSQSILTDATKRALEEGITAMRDYQSALDNFNSYLNSIFGELGSGMMDAIVNNLDSTKNALDDFTQYASSALEKLFQDIAYSMYLAPVFADLQKKITEIYQTAEADKGFDTALAILDVFEKNKPDLDAATEKARKMLQDIREASKAYSYPVFGKEGEVATTAQEIRGVTEDTARRLEGLVNAIRETGVLNLGNVKSLVESNQAIQAYAGQSLSVLRNIDMTTSESLKIFKDLVSSGHSRGTVGLKVFVN